MLSSSVVSTRIPLQVVRVNIDAQAPLLAALTEANAAFSLARQGGQRGDVIRELEAALQAATLSREKLAYVSLGFLLSASGCMPPPPPPLPPLLPPPPLSTLSREKLAYVLP